MFRLINSQYHDDGEESLGPTVASLSLGCPAKMRWRLKAKYWCGFRDKARKHYDPNQPVLRGCRKPEERCKLNELAKTASTEELDKAAQVALAFEKNESKTPPVVLELDLRHGDYMVMHGASMQVYYEVSILGVKLVDWSSTNEKSNSTRSPLPTSSASALHADLSSLRWSPKTCARWEISLPIPQRPTTATLRFMRIL